MTRVPVPLVDRRLRYAVVLAVALVVLAASVTRPPSTGDPGVFLGVPADKWLHAAAYAGLAATIAYARLSRGGSPTARALVLAVVAAVGFGVGVELLQGALPYRSMSAPDVAANAVGAVVGAAPWRLALGASPSGSPPGR